MSSADLAAVFNQHMSGLESLAKGIAGPRFVPPQQPHQFQVLVSPLDGPTAVVPFMLQHHGQMLQGGFGDSRRPACHSRGAAYPGQPIVCMSSCIKMQ